MEEDKTKKRKHRSYVEVESDKESRKGTAKKRSKGGSDTSGGLTQDAVLNRADSESEQMSVDDFSQAVLSGGQPRMIPHTSQLRKAYSAGKHTIGKVINGGRRIAKKFGGSFNRSSSSPYRPMLDTEDTDGNVHTDNVGDNTFSAAESKIILCSAASVFYGIPLSDSDGERRPRPKKKARDRLKGWIRVGTHPTNGLHKYFDNLRNDFIPHEYDLDPSVTINYFGHPLDRPANVRSRNFTIEWVDGKPPHRFDPDHCVFSALLKCAGTCPRHPETTTGDSDSDSTDNDDGDDNTDVDRPELDLQSNSRRSSRSTLIFSDEGKGGEDEDDSDAQSTDQVGGGGPRGGRPKKNKWKCKVRIRVEVRAGNMAQAVIYQWKTHQPIPSDKDLNPSPFIRQGIMESATRFNMTAARIKRHLTHVYDFEGIPIFRRHTTNQVDNIVQNIRKTERVDADPLKCIEIFARHNKESCFLFKNPESGSFSCGLKQLFATQSLILHSRTNGCGLDSCYRRKNEHRAPLTFLTTVDGNRHMLPGTVYLSSNIKADTIAEFLRGTKSVVENHACELVDNPSLICDAHKADSVQLLQEARYIVEHGWKPGFIMIDKSRANLHGIQQVWPDMCVRICQFHIVQAIYRWERDGGKDKGARPRLSLERKIVLLFAVRELQSCDKLRDWASAVKLFEARLDIVLAGLQGIDKSEVLNYFRANWFTKEWLECWTDIGLPQGKYRENILSTNNWTERAFKTFDQVFLDSRANKSMFKLVMILSNDWFPYYETWRKSDFHVDNQWKHIVQKASLIWSIVGSIKIVTNNPDTKSDYWQVIEAPLNTRISKKS